MTISQTYIGNSLTSDVTTPNWIQLIWSIYRRNMDHICHLAKTINSLKRRDLMTQVLTRVAAMALPD